ncbi:MAG TPA: C39 family peptidase [Dehalococcoidia bacterium]|nr:C39 family peptidase [Dehalococcoidia bacterium]
MRLSNNTANAFSPAANAASPRAAAKLAPAPAQAQTLRPADGFTPAKGPVDRNMPLQPQDQGATNSCGTTSLAMIESYFGHPTTHQQIDPEIRAFNLGTAPDDIASYANSHDLRASVKNEGSLEDLAKNVDRGVPTMVLTDAPGNKPDPKNGENHYVVVTGYQRDASGKITKIDVADPWGVKREMDAKDFDSRWAKGKQLGISTGDSRMMISFVPKDGAVTGTDGVTRQAKDIPLPHDSAGSYLDGIAYRSLERRGSDLAGGIQHGDVGKIAGGLFGLVTNVPQMAMQKLAEWSHIPGLERIPEAFAAVNDKIAGGIKAAGEWVQGAVGSVAHGIGSAAKSVAHFFGF